jgi:hypothetical protein
MPLALSTCGASRPIWKIPKGSRRMRLDRLEVRGHPDEQFYRKLSCKATVCII